MTALLASHVSGMLWCGHQLRKKGCKKGGPARSCPQIAGPPSPVSHNDENSLCVVNTGRKTHPPSLHMSRHLQQCSEKLTSEIEAGEDPQIDTKGHRSLCCWWSTQRSIRHHPAHRPLICYLLPLQRSIRISLAFCRLVQLQDHATPRPFHHIVSIQQD